MKNLEIYEVAEFMIGKRVMIQTHGLRRYIGILEVVSNDFLLLSNGDIIDEYESGPWLSAGSLEDAPEGRLGKIVLCIRVIDSIALDEILPPPVEETSPQQQRSMAEFRQDEMESSSPIAHSHLFTVKLSLPFMRLLYVDSDERQVITEVLNNLRKAVMDELGFLVPRIFLTAEWELSDGEYQFLHRDQIVATGSIQAGKRMAILGDDHAPLADEIREPCYGKRAIWIEPSDVDLYLSTAIGVYNERSVFETHLRQTVIQCRQKLLTIKSVEKKTAIQHLAAMEGDVFARLFSSPESILTLHRVLRDLLRDRVWIGCLNEVALSVSEGMRRSQDHMTMMQAVRKKIATNLFRRSTKAAKRPAVVASTDPLVDRLKEDCGRDRQFAKWVVERAIDLLKGSEVQTRGNVYWVLPYELHSALLAASETTRSSVEIHWVTPEELAAAELEHDVVARWDAVDFEFNDGSYANEA